MLCGGIRSWSPATSEPMNGRFNEATLRPRSSLNDPPRRPRVATVRAAEHARVRCHDERAVRPLLRGVDAHSVEAVVEHGPGSCPIGAAEQLTAGPEEQPILA